MHFCKMLYIIWYFYLGHTDVVMGAAVTSDDKLADRLRFLQNGIST